MAKISAGMGKAADYQGKDEGGGMMKVFLICPVRNASDEQREAIFQHINYLRAQGNSVYYPAQDTDQNDEIGYQICKDNLNGIKNADEVHIYYDKYSTGSLFDLGIAFALGKPLKIVNDVEPTPGKSFANMILKWEKNA